MRENRRFSRQDLCFSCMFSTLKATVCVNGRQYVARGDTYVCIYARERLDLKKEISECPLRRSREKKAKTIYADPSRPSIHMIHTDHSKTNLKSSVFMVTSSIDSSSKLQPAIYTSSCCRRTHHSHRMYPPIILRTVLCFASHPAEVMEF